LISTSEIFVHGKRGKVGQERGSGSFSEGGGETSEREMKGRGGVEKKHTGLLHEITERRRFSSEKGSGQKFHSGYSSEGEGHSPEKKGGKVRKRKRTGVSPTH